MRAPSAEKDRSRAPAVRRLLTVLCGVALGSVVLCSVGPASATSPSSAASNGTPRVVAAEYFGTADPLNLWSSDLSGAAATFEQMKADGFNAVGLVVPWGDFEPSLDPPAYNATDFQNLQHLVALAGSLHLGVILRLSYATDVDPQDQLPGALRFTEVFGNQALYDDWLGYVSQLYTTLAPDKNVDVVYLSWEDFWDVVQTAADTTEVAQRKSLAQTVGYTRWLRHHFTLSQVDAAYRTKFSSWAAVPTPLRDQVAFRLFFRFYEAMVVQRFFTAAQQRYPGLTLEARDDVDPITKGDRTVGGFSYNASWRLPGTTLTGVDYHTYMRDPSGATRETAAQAFVGLKATLSYIARRTAGRQLFVNQFLFVDNAPVLDGSPRLAPGQVRPFLRRAGGPLRRYTDGYGIWTYRDYHASLVYNPSFALGLAGWTANGAVTPVTAPDGSSAVSLGPGSSISQAVPYGAFAAGPGSPLTVSFEAQAPSGPAQVGLKVGTAGVQTFTVGPGWQTYQERYPTSVRGHGGLELSSTATVELRDVEVYEFTESGDVYGPNGAPKAGLGALERLNRQVAGSGG